MSVSKQLEEILRQEEHGQKEYRNLKIQRRMIVQFEAGRNFVSVFQLK